MEVESDIYRLERRIGHLERSIAAHGQLQASTSEKVTTLFKQSDDRMDYLKERFDGLESKMDQDESWDKWLVGLMLSIVFAFATTVFVLYMEPMSNQIKAYDRRLIEVEKTLQAVVHSNDLPDP